MARFLADEPIFQPKAANAEHGQSGSVGKGPGSSVVPGKIPAPVPVLIEGLVPEAVEAAAVVFRGHMRKRNHLVMLHKDLRKPEQDKALRDMAEAIKAYLRVARKHAE